MESPNQDAMLNERSQTFRPDTGGPAQIPDDSTMLNQTYDPTDLSGETNTLSGSKTTPIFAPPGRTNLSTDEEEAATGNDDTGAFSGSPNMEPDTTTDGYGNGDTLGNNDGAEDDPEETDPVA